jgi:hypothetical protein
MKTLNLYTGEQNSFDNDKAFDLTYTQCKEIINNGDDLRDFVEQVNNQPEWILAMGGVNDICELRAIIEGGCASGAYMPAVTYCTANKVMAQYGDDVLEYLDQTGVDDFYLNTGSDSWSGFAVKVLSTAVEMWALQFDDITSGLTY